MVYIYNDILNSVNAIAYCYINKDGKTPESNWIVQSRKDNSTTWKNSRINPLDKSNNNPYTLRILSNNNYDSMLSDDSEIISITIDSI